MKSGSFCGRWIRSANEIPVKASTRFGAFPFLVAGRAPMSEVCHVPNSMK
jgi:hypothetical protein